MNVPRGEGPIRPYPLLATPPWNLLGPLASTHPLSQGAQEEIAGASLFQTDQVFLSQDFFFFKRKSRNGKERCEENGNWQSALTSNSLLVSAGA